MSKSNLDRQFYILQLYEATLLTQEERDQIAEKVFAEKLVKTETEQQEQQQSS